MSHRLSVTLGAVGAIAMTSLLVASPAGADGARSATARPARYVAAFNQPVAHEDGGLALYNSTTFKPSAGSLSASPTGGTNFQAIGVASNGTVVAADESNFDDDPDFINDSTGCVDLVLLTPSKATGSYLPDGPDYVGSLALSADAKDVAFRAGPVPAGAGCAAKADRIVVTPVAPQPGEPKTPGNPTGVGIDRGWRADDQISIRYDDHVIATAVRRPGRSHDEIVVVDTAKDTRLSQGTLVNAGTCDLDYPSYLPDGKLLAVRTCGKKIDLVALGAKGSLTHLATVPKGAYGLQAGPDGRALMSGENNDIYVLGANQKGGLHHVTFAAPPCEGDDVDGLCNSYEGFAW